MTTEISYPKLKVPSVPLLVPRLIKTREIPDPRAWLETNESPEIHYGPEGDAYTI